MLGIKRLRFLETIDIIEVKEMTLSDDPATVFTATLVSVGGLGAVSPLPATTLLKLILAGPLTMLVQAR